MTTKTPFTFGLWTVGWLGADPFGSATRAERSIEEITGKLAELGAYGLTAHDDDLFPFNSTEADRRKAIERLKNALDRKSTRLNSSHIQKSRMPSSA